MLSGTGAHKINVPFLVTPFTIMQDCKSSPPVPISLIFGQVWSKALFCDLKYRSL